MSGLFSKPQAPVVLQTPAPPAGDDPAIQSDLEKARRAGRQARGRATTVLTGGQGLLDEPATARRTLLGI